MKHEEPHCFDTLFQHGILPFLPVRGFVHKQCTLKFLQWFTLVYLHVHHRNGNLSGIFRRLHRLRRVRNPCSFRGVYACTLAVCIFWVVPLKSLIITKPVEYQIHIYSPYLQASPNILHPLDPYEMVGFIPLFFLVHLKLYREQIPLLNGHGIRVQSESFIHFADKT